MLPIRYSLSIKRIEAIIRLKAHEAEYVKVCPAEAFFFIGISPPTPIPSRCGKHESSGRQSDYSYKPFFFHVCDPLLYLLFSKSCAYICPTTRADKTFLFFPTLKEHPLQTAFAKAFESATGVYSKVPIEHQRSETLPPMDAREDAAVLDYSADWEQLPSSDVTSVLGAGI
ncbi:hypothetical protein BS47DRAFT_972111 [Hydnum rufescens UP504]|uniref:Uncharacterized protein n=1 Tax=Hydnum rufescens UP504 TaxID=1448309 RepID=A0A9P6AWW4_9AGAM|nr:hypothetical protein BS47DRAFT_972111 [Hydnum rufescens UP504]